MHPIRHNFIKKRTFFIYFAIVIPQAYILRQGSRELRR